MKVGDGATKVGSLKFADEGQYLPLAGGTLTGPLNRGAITMNSQSGGGSGYGYDSLIFYQTSAGATTSNAKVAFQYRIPTGTSSGTMRVVAPEFEGKLIGNADTATTATTASKVTNALSINGKSYNGSAAIDVGAIGIAYGGTGKTTRKEALTALLGQTSTTNLNEVLEQGTYHWAGTAEDYNAPTDYGTLICLVSSGDMHNNSSNWLTHIAVGTDNTLYWRQKVNALAFKPWKTILDSNNYSAYAATKDHNHDDVYLKTLPIASTTTLGGVKIGSGLTVAEDGTISAAAAYTLPTASSTTKGGIKVGTGLTMSSETLNHSNSITAKTAYGSTATTASANGGKIVVTDVKYDAQGFNRPHNYTLPNYLHPRWSNGQHGKRLRNSTCLLEWNCLDKHYPHVGQKRPRRCKVHRYSLQLAYRIQHARWRKDYFYRFRHYRSHRLPHYRRRCLL